MVRKITSKDGTKHGLPTPNHNVPKFLIEELENSMRKEDAAAHKHAANLFEGLVQWTGRISEDLFPRIVLQCHRMAARVFPPLVPPSLTPPSLNISWYLNSRGASGAIFVACSLSLCAKDTQYNWMRTTSNSCCAP